jgi:hypothetical protein
MSAFLHYYSQIDPPHIFNKNYYLDKEKERKRIIRAFLLKSYYNNYSKISDPKDVFLVKNTYKFFKLATLISLTMSGVFHKFLFSGVYEFRSFYFNPQRIPLLIKLGISFTFGIFVLNGIWINYTYNPFIYEVSLKYKGE